MIDSRLLRALKAIAPALFPREPYLAPRKYRLVRMRPSVSSSELTRAELQIVNAAPGMPDMLLVSIYPGMAGSWAELRPGAFVLVQFVDGDPSQPYVCGFSTRDEPGWKPLNLTLDTTGTMSLGESAGTVELKGNDPTIASGPAAVGRPVRYGESVSVGTAAGVITFVTGLGFPAAASKVDMAP